MKERLFSIIQVAKCGSLIYLWENWKYRARAKVWEVSVKQSSRHFHLLTEPKATFMLSRKTEKVFEETYDGNSQMQNNWVADQVSYYVAAGTKKKNPFLAKLKRALRRQNSHLNSYPQSFFKGMNYHSATELSICDKPLFEVTGTRAGYALPPKSMHLRNHALAHVYLLENNREQVIWMIWILTGLNISQRSCGLWIIN